MLPSMVINMRKNTRPQLSHEGVGSVPCSHLGPSRGHFKIVTRQIASDQGVPTGLIHPMGHLWTVPKVHQRRKGALPEKVSFTVRGITGTYNEYPISLIIMHAA